MPLDGQLACEGLFVPLIPTFGGQYLAERLGTDYILPGMNAPSAFHRIPCCRQKPALPANDSPAPRERENIVILALHQIFFRLGWLFKTETVVVPTLVDYLAGPAWVRGLLPTLSRVGQSLPPIFLIDRMSSCSRYKWYLASCTASMSLLFLVAAWIWNITEPQKPSWVCPVVLILYLGFFVANGFYQVFFGSLQGKLIRPEHRGQLLQLSTFIGTIPSVFLAWYLLGPWFAHPATGFGNIFLAATVGFGAASLAVLFVAEPRQPEERSTPFGGDATGWWDALSQDKDLRRLLVICALVSTNWMLSPHYQAFGKAKFDAAPGHLAAWVMVQSIAVGVFSLVVGWVADWKGNRLAMRLLVFGSAGSPLAALVIVALGAHVAAQWYWLVYVSMGLAPLVGRIIFNYALELCQPRLHPTYQGITNLGLAFPLAFSPFLGWIIDVTSFEFVFGLAAGVLLLAGWLTFFLPEPRYRLPRPMVAGVPPQSPE